ncbi:MAG: PAS domain-containing protein [Chthoniobacteraceae bacterium]
MDHFPEVLAIYDSVGRIQFLNARGQQFMSWSDMQYIGKRDEEILPSEITATYLPTLKQALATGMTQVTECVLPWPSSETPTVFRLTYVPLQDDHGAIRQVLGIARDLTEQRRLEREVLEISGREQRRFGQDLHDDLCQQLAGLGLHCHLLARELAVVSAEHAAQAEGIEVSLRRATERARGLARGLAPVVIEAEGLLAALRELTIQAGEMFRIKSSCECSEETQVRDPEAALQLYRIAQEAISNAVRHGGAQSVVLSLVLRDEKLCLTIANDGRPLPEPLTPGEGMGLRIMRHRAAVLGGTIELRAGAEGGVEVVGTFPRKLSKNP